MANNTSWLAIFQKWVIHISKLFDWAGRGFLVICILLVILNIIGTLVGTPIPGTYEYVGVLTALTISLSLAYCQVNKGHIRITLLVDRFSPGVQAAIGTVNSIISTILFGLVVYAKPVKEVASKQSTKPRKHVSPAENHPWRTNSVKCPVTIYDESDREVLEALYSSRLAWR